MDRIDIAVLTVGGLAIARTLCWFADLAQPGPYDEFGVDPEHSSFSGPDEPAAPDASTVRQAGRRSETRGAA